MKENNVRRINQAVQQQAFKGNVAVNCDQGRVFKAKTVGGQLKVKTGSGKWYDAASVDIR
jgi:hypothetical protein